MTTLFENILIILAKKLIKKGAQNTPLSSNFLYHLNGGE